MGISLNYFVYIEPKKHKLNNLRRVEKKVFDRLLGTGIIYENLVIFPQLHDRNW